MYDQQKEQQKKVNPDTVELESYQQKMKRLGRKVDEFIWG